MNREVLCSVSDSIDISRLCQVEQLLSRNQLLRLDTPQLTARYNDCLARLGLPPTELSRLSIDARGWSPEVAESLGDPWYLSAGTACPCAIILTPNQLTLNVVFPSYSFEETALQSYFEQNRRQIGDVTGSHGMVVEFDMGFTRYLNPTDMLLIQRSTLRTSLGGLEQQVQSQRRLVDEFRELPYAWFDKNLRRRLVASARAHGDLRSRKTEIPELTVEFESFSSRLCGGIFILRPKKGEVPCLVLEDEDWTKAAIGASHRTFTVHDRRLLIELFERDLIEVDLAGLQATPELLERKRRMLIGYLLSSHHTEVSPGELHSAKTKRLLSALPWEELRVLDELERLIGRLTGNQRVRFSDISGHLRAFLATPARELPESERRILDALLARIDPIDPLRMAGSDRHYLVRQFLQWPQAQQQWVIDLLAQEEGESK